MKKENQFKTKEANQQVLILIGRNMGGRIHKPITSVKIDGIPIPKVVEWLKNAIASDLHAYGTLDMEVIDKLSRREATPCN